MMSITLKILKSSFNSVIIIKNTVYTFICGIVTSKAHVYVHNEETCCKILFAQNKIPLETKTSYQGQGGIPC